jgi:hypothetical protein
LCHRHITLQIFWDKFQVQFLTRRWYFLNQLYLLSAKILGLFHKLLLNNINGKMYNIIFNMYTSVKSCISYNNHTTGYFNCEIGVRQGENLSLFFLTTMILIHFCYLNTHDSYTFLLLKHTRLLYIRSYMINNIIKIRSLHLLPIIYWLLHDGYKATDRNHTCVKQDIF